MGPNTRRFGLTANQVTVPSETFYFFSSLPVELQIQIWRLASQTPRIIEVHGYGFSAGRQYPHRRTLRSNPKFNPPCFAFHPLLHVCSLARSAYRTMDSARLPLHLKGMANNCNWVVSAHIEDYDGKAVWQPRNSVENAKHFFLNFYGQRDGSWEEGDIFFDNGTSWYEPLSQSEWLTRCGVRRLACDIREFYAEQRGGRDMGWRLVQNVHGIEELVLVLVPRETGWRKRNEEVKFIELDDDGVIREERVEMSMWRKVHEMEIAKAKVSRASWKVPLVRFVVARKGPLGLGYKEKEKGQNNHF